MTRGGTPLLVLALILVLSVGCFARFDEGDAGPRIPEGPPETIGGPATGPVEVLATGMTEEFGWRYSIYPSADGLCVQFEHSSGNSGGGSAGCGIVDVSEPISRVGGGAAGPEGGHVDGLASPEVAELMLRTTDGRTFPAELFDLSDSGVEGRAFLILVPPGVDPTTVVALDENGEELGVADMSRAFGPPRDQAPAQPPDTTSSAS